MYNQFYSQVMLNNASIQFVRPNHQCLVNSDMQLIKALLNTHA